MNQPRTLGLSLAATAAAIRRAADVLPGKPVQNQVESIALEGMKLMVRRRRGRKRALGTRAPIELPQAPNPIFNSSNN